MSKINSHPILDVPKRDKVVFTLNGKKIEGEKGFTIAAALHQAGYPVHSHSLDGRGRSLACGIGKCGACEMLVDGKTFFSFDFLTVKSEHHFISFRNIQNRMRINLRHKLLFY